MSNDKLIFFISLIVFILLAAIAANAGLSVLGKPSAKNDADQKPKFIFRLFGIRSEADTISLFGNPIWTRYGLSLNEGKKVESCKEKVRVTAQIEDRALTYVERVIDRQINKVRGILTLDSIFIVASRELFEKSKESSGVVYIIDQGLLEFGIYCLIASIGLSLFLLFVRIGRDGSKYANIQDEFNETVELIRKRTIPIQISIWASLAAVSAFVVALLLSWSQAAASPTHVPAPTAAVAAYISPHDIFFDVNATVPRRESEAALMGSLQELEDKPTLNVEIQGHADDKGKDADNLKLSAERAAAIGGWLISHGIPANRLKATGYSSGRPAFKSPTRLGHAWNRRVEFHQVG